MTKQYNTTQLEPFKAIERGIVHRDMIAHVLRWTHILNIAKIGMNILDVGCGSGNMYEVFYRNRYSPNNYTGVDIREKTIESNKIKFPKANFLMLDIVNNKLPENNWDLVTSFEVIEHIGKQNGEKFLENIKQIMNSNTIFCLSTPCYDEKVGAADNHIINGQIGEYTYNELKELLEKHFTIAETYGTFASQKDYKDKMNEHQTWMFERLHNYYDSNLISNIMAPMFPEYSRNVFWKCKLK